VTRLDDRLRRDLEGAARPADPSGVYEELIRRRERRRIGRRIQAGGLALFVVAGTVVGTYALSRAFRGGSTAPGQHGSPAPTTSPSPSSSTQEQRGIGLGFPVCNVTSVQGHFSDPDTLGTAFVATKASDLGCPTQGDGLTVIAVDLTGDGQADVSDEPVECANGCSAFATPDIDGDGTDEILVQNVQFSIAGLKLFDVRVLPGLDAWSLFPVKVAPPGDPAGRFAPGKEPQLWLGGDGFNHDALDCRTGPDGRVFVATSAESRPHDSPDAVWFAHETTFMLRDEGELNVVGTRDFHEPVTGNAPSFATGDRLCGSTLGPSS